MIDLKNNKLSYLVISSPCINDIISILYAKEYEIINIKTYYNEEYNDAIIAYNNINNDELRGDIIFILNHFKENSAIVKYSGDDNVKRISFNGSEKPMCIKIYNTDNNYISYIYDGVSFSFINEKRYWIPTKKEDFKIGMVVEYLNNNRWYEKEIKNPSLEYDGFFKLLIKYNKLRVPSNLA